MFLLPTLELRRPFPAPLQRRRSRLASSRRWPEQRAEEVAGWDALHRRQISLEHCRKVRGADEEARALKVMTLSFTRVLLQWCSGEKQDENSLHATTTHREIMTRLLVVNHETIAGSVLES